MVAGYAGYYLCRSDLAVALPLLIAEMGKRGIAPDDARIRLGMIASLGVLAYAVGKFPSGWLADFLGGRRNFLFGMAGSILFTVWFGLAGGIPLFTFVWMGNRLAQSMGWAGMVKIASRWFSYSSYGTVMGILSLSFLFGDAASREFMSWLIGAGLGWRGVFCVAAATLGLLLLASLLLLRETPEEIGYPEPPANPANLFHSEGEKHTPESLRSLLGTFGRSRVFWLVCLISCGITILRETFNLWGSPWRMRRKRAPCFRCLAESRCWWRASSATASARADEPLSFLAACCWPRCCFSCWRSAVSEVRSWCPLSWSRWSLSP
jgi:OPA family glycerol-3-phosphate transporter-like MFS transporter